MSTNDQEELEITIRDVKTGNVLHCTKVMGHYEVKPRQQRADPPRSPLRRLNSFLVGMWAPFYRRLSNPQLTSKGIASVRICEVDEYGDHW